MDIKTILAEHVLFITSNGTNGKKADLYGANLRGATLPKFQLTSAGTMKVYKKASNKVVELIIPPSAKRTSSLVGRKF